MQTEEILLAYEKRKWIRRCSVVGFFVAEIAWIATTDDLLPQQLRLGGAFLLLLILVVVEWRYWRCPACDRMLARVEGKHCPECGTRLVA